ncbi:MAG TPA: hypothetical protein VGJ04_05620 [Pirellulales bacterium]
MNDPDKPPRQVSIPSLIGWLSLCMLAATWGRTIDPQWQGLWAKAGTVGLIAAVMLERTEKLRNGRKTKIRREAARVVSEDRLTRLNEQQTTHSLIADAINELCTYAGPDLSHYPLHIIPVNDDDEAFEIDSAPSIKGSLITLSPHTVSFAHDEEFERQVVLLQFKLQRSKSLYFVAQIIGTQWSDAEFISTGGVLATGVLNASRAETDCPEALQTT